jgi:hypothetical protein
VLKDLRENMVFRVILDYRDFLGRKEIEVLMVYLECQECQDFPDVLECQDFLGRKEQGVLMVYLEYQDFLSQLEKRVVMVSTDVLMFKILRQNMVSFCMY